MNYSLRLGCALVAIVIVSIGCGGGNSGGMTASTGTTVKITPTPGAPYTGLNVGLYVTASNDHLALKSLAIDYTGDGTWDETRNFNSSSIGAAFSHAYDIAGTYQVLVEARDENDLPTFKVLSLVVTEQTSVLVTYQMVATSREGGDCGVIGPPAECTGCSQVVTASPGLTKTLGTYPQGSEVNFTQTFAQSVFTGGSIAYACNFVLTVRVGAVGSEQTIASGVCSTSSTANPPHLNCFISVDGFVP